jgi:neutral trehalase
MEKAKLSARNVANKASKPFTVTARKLLPRKHTTLTPEDVQEARDYIRAFWHRLERFHPKDDESLLGLPKPSLVPSYQESAGFDYNELYYWDSF